ncbi:MAG: glycosyltransferase family 2 protein [Culicoidibacterales bacterium]
MNISIAMCTYNGQKFIKEQLESILIQLSAEDEVVISDDGSQDDTLKIIKQYSENDSRIKVFQNKLSLGVVNNFEYAINHCQNEIIFFSDQDDIWLGNKVEKIKKIFEKNKNIDVVISDLEVFNSNTGEVLSKSFIESNGSKQGFVNNLLRNSYIGCAMAVRKSYLKEILPFPKNIPMHDWWIGLNSELDKKTYIIKEPLIKYRRHENNVTGIVKNNLLVKAKYRFIILKSIINQRFRIKW